MNSAKSLRSGALLMLTAAIWGAAFVAQSAGMEFIGPFTFNGLRTLIGAVVLIPVAWAVHRAHGAPIPWKKTLAGGAVCGLVFFAAVNLQQIGIQYTTAGKAGFITAMYVVLVPIVGLALGKRPGVLVWAGVVLACAGMYLLCMTDGLSLGRGDALILASAFGFTAHILVIDRFAADVDGIVFSIVQFAVAGTLSCLVMAFTETPSIPALAGAAPAILYAGVLSCGAGYTLQIVAQKNVDPTVASILLSLESVFAAVFGALILHESMTSRELLGCALMFAAIVLAQLPAPKRAKSEKRA